METNEARIRRLELTVVALRASAEQQEYMIGTLISVLEATSRVPVSLAIETLREHLRMVETSVRGGALEEAKAAAEFCTRQLDSWSNSTGLKQPIPPPEGRMKR